VDHPKPQQKQGLGAVRVHGPDALAFLQGQLSNDVMQLSAAQPMLAGLHNPQGRAIAVLRLFLAAPDEVLAVLPRELVTAVITRLSKFVLRSKVKLSEAETPLEERRLLDIQQGIPQVYAATSEAFVAQMLNLDVVGGISFGKGCYTGQEVIARAHYRGRIKRRMQRFRTTSALMLAPGDSGMLPDGRSVRVVDAAQLPDGRCEFLAVAPLTAAEAPTGETPASADAAETTPSAARIDAEPLSLPYALPE
jgi:tRNA-modifying protein YgfZ